MSSPHVNIYFWGAEPENEMNQMSSMSVMKLMKSTESMSLIKFSLEKMMSSLPPKINESYDLDFMNVSINPINSITLMRSIQSIKFINILGPYRSMNLVLGLTWELHEINLMIRYTEINEIRQTLEFHEYMYLLFV